MGERERWGTQMVWAVSERQQERAGDTHERWDVIAVCETEAYAERCYPDRWRWKIEVVPCLRPAATPKGGAK